MNMEQNLRKLLILVRFLSAFIASTSVSLFVIGLTVSVTKPEIYDGDSAKSTHLATVATLYQNENKADFQTTDQATAQAAELSISEIMFNPLTGGNTNGDDLEFLELHNRGAVAYDLGGYTFDTGISYQFAMGISIPSGGYLVLAKGPAAFQNRYGFDPHNETSYGGRLSNSGETLSLLNDDSQHVLSVEYDAAIPSLIPSNGIGFSLVPAESASSPTTIHDWRVSTYVHGSPAQDDPVRIDPIPPVLINEILAHTDLPQRDYVELYNPTESSADIGGWFITDTLAEPRKYRVPSGTQISSRGYMVFDENQLGFRFSALGESIYLLSSDLTGAHSGYGHGFTFGVTPNEVSLGRCTSIVSYNTFDEQLVLQAEISEGHPNREPLVGPVVISELMATPISGDEYIELTNLASIPIPLYDPVHPENLWQISNIGSYTLPLGSFIPANGILLIVSIDPSTFRTRYAIPDSVPIVGPYPGQLSDTGERIALLKPDSPDSDGTVPYYEVDVVEYDDRAPWPTTGQDGKSLERINLNGFGNSARNWRTSNTSDGTPGTLHHAVPYTNSLSATTINPTSWRLFEQGTNRLYLPLISRDWPLPEGLCLPP
ncbi:MAG: lamin tail domain-containing protein [Chloroflexota bacterium]